MDLSKEVFKGKTMSNLFNEIYENSKSTKSQILELIKQLSDIIENPDDGRRIVPLIKEYLEIGVKNDEHLIKLATVIQRLESKTKEDASDFDISEIQDLIEEQEKESKKLEKNNKNKK